MDSLETLPKPFFALAPLDDVTDTVFRRIIGNCASPDLYFTEFVNVDGLQSPGRPKLLKKLIFTEAETPLIAQIWGKTPENFYKTARQLANGTFARELGLPDGINFAGVDLNMGCPDKTIVKNGTCSALINDREKATEIIKSTKDGLAGKLPLSVKTRLGFNEIDMTWIEFLLGQDLYMLTIHGRTRREMSKVPAHWDEIGEARKLRDKLAPDTLIVGNGDVESRQQGLELAKKYGIDGTMIGRGVFHDPFAFAENSPWPDMPPEKTPHEIISPEEEPDDASIRAGIERIKNLPPRPTWEDYQSRGDQAYAEAVAREETHGLDEATVAMYREASVNLINVTATGPIDKVRRESQPADPVRLLKIAGSLAKQAQVAEVKPYEEYGSQHINRRSNLRRISTETLQRASRMMMGEDSHADHAAMIAEFDVDSPAEVVVTAAVEAARETGTAEYVYGPEAVDKDTPERLESEGEDALVRFIGEHAMESGPQGLEFVARTAEIAVEAVEEITGEHKLPAAA